MTEAAAEPNRSHQAGLEPGHDKVDLWPLAPLSSDRGRGDGIIGLNFRMTCHIVSLIEPENTI
jgi:hypothetical protein